MIDTRAFLFEIEMSLVQTWTCNFVFELVVAIDMDPSDLINLSA